VALQAILDHARAAPGRPALVHEGGTWSCSEFARRILAARERLAGLGLHEGAIVVVAIAPLPEAWVYALALRSLGHAALPANGADGVAQLPSQQVGGLLHLEGAPPGASLAALAARAGWKQLAVPRSRPEAFPGDLPEAWPHSANGIGDHILMTSGTTGVFKLVRRGAATDLATVPDSAAIYGMEASSVAHVGNFPLWTAGGYRWALAAWHAGAAVVFDQGQWPRLGHPELRITHLFATPALLAWLLTAPDGALRHDDSMHILVTAGSLPREVAEAARARLSRRISTVFASTETLTLGITPYETTQDLRWHRILPSRVVEVVDESGLALRTGTVGQVRARIEDGLRGYLGDELATRRFFRDGWFYPGDLGEFRGDGRLALHGRVVDVINIRGTKVATGPIEQALQDGLRVPGVCVLSLPAQSGDEEVHVAIESKRPVARADLERLAASHLRLAAQVHFHVLERLPRNAMGKVVRAELRQVLLGRQPRAG